MADVAPLVVRIDLSLDRLAAALTAAPDIVEEELIAAVTQASLLAKAEIRDRTPTSGAGTLRDSIGAMPVTIGAERIRGGVGTASPYALPVETGSRPHMPPANPIREWVYRKLGKRGKDLEETAEAIRWAIKHRGTPAHWMFRDGMAHVESQVREEIDAAADRALARIEASAGGGP